MVGENFQFVETEHVESISEFHMTNMGQDRGGRGLVVKVSVERARNEREEKGKEGCPGGFR